MQPYLHKALRAVPEDIEDALKMCLDLDNNSSV